MVAIESQFTDRTDYDQRRYDRARESRPRAAAKRAAGEFATGELDLDSKPDQETAQLIADFGHVMASANVLMAEYEDFTEAYRLFVDALIGLAGDRTGWFEATDKLVAGQAGRGEKWVQRTRKDFMAWQKKRLTSYVDIDDHIYDPTNGNKPHKYRVYVAHIAAAATLDARARPREFAANPGKALASSTNNLRSMLPTPTHKRHKPDRPADAEKQIKRALNHIGTLMLRVEEIQSASGGRVEINLAKIEELENRLAVLKAAALDPLSTIPKEKIVDINRARRSAAPVHPSLTGNARAQDLDPSANFTDEQHAEYETAVDGVCQHNIEKDMTPQDAYRAALAALGNIDKFFADQGGGGHFDHPPQATVTEPTVKPDLSVELDENSETPTQTYTRLAGEIYDREEARGKTRNEAGDAVDREMGTFSVWLKRRRE
jgi:hypothetical protein